MSKPPPAKKPSVIDQAIMAFKETWLRVDAAVDELMRETPAPPAKPVARVVAAGASAKVIGKGSKGDAVQELRIRLAGFGGLLPGDEFDDKVVDSVKQFERDVMKREPTGKVDHTFAASLDKFAADWPIEVEKTLACQCLAMHRLLGCEGFGKGQFKGEYRPGHEKDRDEAFHMYEYPGIHRSVIWASRALMHYAELDHPNEIKFHHFSSAYRCHKDNSAHTSKDKKTGKKVPRSTTNHMGKALDIQFSYKKDKNWIVGNSKDTKTCENVNRMRKVAVARMNAQYGWGDKGKFSLETAAQGATSWVHIDVRAWSAKDRDDAFFVRTSADLNGAPMVQLLSLPSNQVAPQTQDPSPKPSSPDQDIQRPATETEQLLAAVVYCESRGKYTGGEDADEKDAIASCFLNRVYYGNLAGSPSGRNKKDFGATLLEAIVIGSTAHNGPLWNRLMAMDRMKETADLVQEFSDPSDREHFRLSCEAASRFASKTSPIALGTLGNSAPAAFNRANDAPPGIKGRLRKIGHVGAHTFYGFTPGRELQ